MDRIQTILRNGGDGSLYLEDRRTEVIKVTRLRQRPDKRSHRIYLDQDRSLNVIDYEYRIHISLKGRYDSREGRSVLLKFKLYPSKTLYCRTHDSINCRAEWTSLVSIVDSEGCLRYPQSLTLMYDGIERPEEDEESIQVVSADSLLREADVLLPDDTLTIQVDMVLKQYYAGERCKHKHIVFGDLLDWSFEIQSSSGVIRYRRLRLDSPLGELLREESRYFERLCATNMVEKNTGFLEIPEEEEATFIKMVNILSHPHVQRQISFRLNATIEDILGVYRMSHLYEIESVLDTCRCWLELVCRKYAFLLTKVDFSAISEIAETYDDPIFGELVETLKGNEETQWRRYFARLTGDVSTEISELAETYNNLIIRGIARASPRNLGETEIRRDVEREPWTCRHLTRQLASTKQFFRFEEPPKIKKEEHRTEDVGALSHCYI